MPGQHSRAIFLLLTITLAVSIINCGGGGGDTIPLLSNEKAITGYSFAGTGSTGIIDENAKTISVTVPYGTGLTALVATFTTTGARVSVDSVVQESGTTPNDFTNPVGYVVIAANGSTAAYTVTVTVAANPAKEIIAFSFPLQAVAGTIDEGAKTVTVAVPYGTNVTALIATFATTGTTVEVGSTVQASGITPNDFTNPVNYVVTAADGSAAAYSVIVTVALNPAKAMTAFSLDGVMGIINESTKTITVAMPYGTNMTALVAIFTVTGDNVKVGSVVQQSGTTPNDFTSPIVYTVTAQDGTTADYRTTVTKWMLALPDTGQMTSYTTTTGEDSDYSINPLSYVDNGDGTISDNVTGLMWLKCTMGRSGNDCSAGTATAYNWYQASGIAEATYNPGGAVNVCGSLNFAGHSDWRLPSDIELMSIMDFGRSQPAIDTAYFPGTSSWYWSVNAYAGNTTAAWRVGFNDYEGVGYTTKSTAAGTFVRCVR